MRSLLLSLLFISITESGCGPLMYPAVRRLDADGQREVDQIWTNLLTPPGKVDRETLLDALILFQLHHNGIDRLSLTAEKEIPNQGRAVLEVKFDRMNPGIDAFSVTIFDRTGQLCRAETYTGAEVLRHIDEFSGSSGNQPAGEMEAQLIEARMQRVMAATQPSRDVQ